VRRPRQSSPRVAVPTYPGEPPGSRATRENGLSTAIESERARRDRPAAAPPNSALPHLPQPEASGGAGHAPAAACGLADCAPND